MNTYPATVVAVQPVIEPLYLALQHGLKVAAEIHGQHRWRRRHDKQYYSHTVRRRAVEDLRDGGFVVDEDDHGNVPAMSGITVRHGGVALRMYRAPVTRKGVVEVPLPRRSLKLQAFYRQEAGSVLPGMETNNVLGLWQDDEGVLIDPIILVRPLGGDHRKENLRLDWKGPLRREMANYRAVDLTALEPDVQYPRLDEGMTG